MGARTFDLTGAPKPDGNGALEPMARSRPLYQQTRVEYPRRPSDGERYVCMYVYIYIYIYLPTWASGQAPLHPHSRGRDQLAVGLGEMAKSRMSPSLVTRRVAHFVWENRPTHGPPHTKTVPPQQLPDTPSFAHTLRAQRWSVVLRGKGRQRQAAPPQTRATHPLRWAMCAEGLCCLCAPAPPAFSSLLDGLPLHGS